MMQATTAAILVAANTPPSNNENSYRYLLPCCMTFAGLFCGFCALIALMQAQLVLCCAALYFAMICDTADGFLARMTASTTQFGAQLDSLCDVINFGVIPACLTYNFSFYVYGAAGMLISFIFLLSTTIRLARFNANKQTSQSTFQGMPCTPAAGLICGIFWYLQHQYGAATLISQASSLGFISLSLSLLQLSTIPYPKMKNLLASQYQRSWLVIAIICVPVATTLYYQPLLTPVSMLGFYALSGILSFAYTCIALTPTSS
jgi:CDP-diacylglycerol---serine O-phosphatidyltransferase